MSAAEAAAQLVLYERGSIKPIHGSGPSTYEVKGHGGERFFMDEYEAKQAYALIRQGRKGALGRAEDGTPSRTSTSSGSSSASSSSAMFATPPQIPPIKKPAYTQAGNRYIQLVTLPAFPSLSTTWPDPGWTHPVEGYVRSRLIQVSDSMMSHVKFMMETGLNSMILHLNQTVDMMFDTIVEMGNSLIGGVNTTLKTMTDSLNQLQRDLKAQIDSLTSTVKAELAAARKAIDDTLAQAKAEINRLSASIKDEMAAARKEMQTLMKNAQDEATKQFAALQVKLIDSAKVELEKSRKETVASIQKEAEAARAAITKSVNDAIAALPKEVARVTAEEFQARGLVSSAQAQAPAAAAPSGGGGFKWPFSGFAGEEDEALGFVGQPDIAETDDVFVQDAPEERVIDGAEPEYYLQSYARATRQRLDQDEDELGYT